MMPKNSQKSFTIIEVLVVIAVIGLLMTIVLVSLTSVRAKTRDNRRMAELLTLAKSLEFYYSEHGQYPESTDWIKIEENATFTTAMAPYISDTPEDPSYQLDGEYSYQYTTEATGGTEYKACATMENYEDPYCVNSVFGGSIVFDSGEPWFLTEDNCNTLDGWYWYNTNGREACWSKTLADYVSWNKGVGDDTDNPGAYTCATAVTNIENRMLAASNKEWYKIVSNVAGTTITSSHNGSYSVISALAIADCVDGVRDLCSTDGCLGADIAAVNSSLATWASATGDKSAIPYCAGSGCSSPISSDWRNICEQGTSNDLPLDCYDGYFRKNLKACGDTDSNHGWTAAVHDGAYVVCVGSPSCDFILNGATGYAGSGLSFRVVVRP